MHGFLEPRVRRLVAETLGVDVDDLVPDVSLTDDLAADSLDFAELAVRFENELGIALPDRLIAHIRTYGELVRTAMTLTRTSRPLPPVAEPLPLWTRVVSPSGQLMRADIFTPYAAETIAEDALHAGRGARLEVMVAATTADAELARVREEFAWLEAHGIGLTVGREGGRTHYPSAAA